MKIFKVKYLHGQFVEIETKKRIILKQGEEYLVSSNDDAFDERDPRLAINEILDSDAKQKLVEKLYGLNHYIKILNKGDQLFYRVGNSKTIKGDEQQYYIFLCTILEDLYIHIKKNKKGDHSNDWVLSNCVCRLESCLSSSIIISEKIQTDSLNKLFSKTVTFYFNMQRSPTANAFTTFHLFKPGVDILYQAGFSNGSISSGFTGFENLDNLRSEIVRNFIENGYKTTNQ